MEINQWLRKKNKSLRPKEKNLIHTLQQKKLDSSPKRPKPLPHHPPLHHPQKR
eukprot:UN14515